MEKRKCLEDFPGLKRLRLGNKSEKICKRRQKKPIIMRKEEIEFNTTEEKYGW